MRVSINCGVTCFCEVVGDAIVNEGAEEMIEENSMEDSRVVSKENRCDINR